jgi:hexosaminidase
VNLLPYPRSLVREAGFFVVPGHAVCHFESDLPRDNVLLPLAERLRSAAESIDVRLEVALGPRRHPRLAISASVSAAVPDGPDGYQLQIARGGIALNYREEGGLRAGIATLRQLLRQYGRRLPLITIRDYADFPRRGVMLDISRGRVPKLKTLLELVDHLADFKINEFQLYTEHTFAYRNYEPVWRDWGALTGEEILLLDARCRQLGIDLVPNQNSFGHLRYWLEHPSLKKLAEVSEPYESTDATFLRYPSTLAPGHPGTLRFLRELFDELLPHFSSRRFNVGCDETWDLGRGQSKRASERKGKHRVYFDFLKKIYREVSVRDHQMMFWGDIILHYPELIRELPPRIIALNWGYEADHPFDRETRLFAQSKVPFYVCPGTSSWMTLIGRHDNAFTNLRQAAAAGHRNGAIGFLNTDWGDGGHPQPLAVSYLPYLTGAALSWCAASFDENLLIPVLSLHVFQDETRRLASAAMGLGLAHRKFAYFAPNVTPFGAVIAAPPPPLRELVCRDGLKYYARIPEKNIRSALEEVEVQRALLSRSRPSRVTGETLAAELDLAARMAVQSCKLMLWQQALAGNRLALSNRLARRGVRELLQLDRDFNSYWPLRNKGTSRNCSAFLRWRIDDYRRRSLYYPPDQARLAAPKISAAA